MLLSKRGANGLSRESHLGMMQATHTQCQPRAAQRTLSLRRSNEDDQAGNASANS